MPRWFGLISAMGLCGVIVYGMALLPSAPTMPQPGAYRASVLQVLRAHSLEAQAVEIADGCAPTVERCQAYAGAVTVIAGTRMTGRIDCRARWTGCTLTVAAARIDRAPLPDAIDPFAWRVGQLRAELRGWLRKVVGG